MSRRYCVVLGDVVNSRKIDDRETFQEELEAALSGINTNYRESIDAPFSILKGVDEIGGVMESVRPIADIQKSLQRAIHPEQVRLAAVIGEIDVNPGTSDIAEVDGSALSRADDVLSELESSNLTFRLDGGHSPDDDLISDEINLLDMIRADWSERQLEIISLYEQCGSQKAVAESLDVSPQAISKALRNSKGNRVLQIENRLDDVLQSYPPIEQLEGRG